MRDTALVLTCSAAPPEVSLPPKRRAYRRAPVAWRTSECGTMLSGNGADFARELAKNELFELNLRAGIVDIDAHKVSLGVVIELHTLRDFPSFDAHLFGKVDIQ